MNEANSGEDTLGTGLAEITEGLSQIGKVLEADREKSYLKRSFKALKAPNTLIALAALVASLAAIGWSVYSFSENVTREKLMRLEDQRSSVQDDLSRLRAELRSVMREALDSRNRALIASKVMQVLSSDAQLDEALMWQSQRMESEVQIRRALSIMKDIRQRRIDLLDVNEKIAQLDKPEDPPTHYSWENAHRRKLPNNLPNGGSAGDYYSLAFLSTQNGSFRSAGHFVEAALTLDKLERQQGKSRLAIECKTLKAIIQSRKIFDGAHETEYAKTFKDLVARSDFEGLEQSLLRAGMLAVWANVESAGVNARKSDPVGELELIDKLIDVEQTNLDRIHRSQVTNIVDIHKDLLQAARLQIALALARIKLGDGTERGRDAADKLLKAARRHLLYAGERVVASDPTLTLTLLQSKLLLERDAPSDWRAAEQLLESRLSGMAPFDPAYPQIEFWKGVATIRCLVAEEGREPAPPLPAAPDNDRDEAEAASALPRAEKLLKELREHATRHGLPEAWERELTRLKRMIEAKQGKAGIGTRDG